jgi:hypothetical protein
MAGRIQSELRLWRGNEQESGKTARDETYRLLRRTAFCICRSSLETAKYSTTNPLKTTAMANNITRVTYNKSNSSPLAELLQRNQSVWYPSR